jgi:hypothetical protein
MNDVAKDIASTIASACLFFSWQHLDPTTSHKSTIVILQSVIILKVEVAQKNQYHRNSTFLSNKTELYNAFGQIS